MTWPGVCLVFAACSPVPHLTPAPAASRSPSRADTARRTPARRPNLAPRHVAAFPVQVVQNQQPAHAHRRRPALDICYHLRTVVRVMVQDVDRDRHVRHIGPLPPHHAARSRSYFLSAPQKCCRPRRGHLAPPGRVRACWPAERKLRASTRLPRRVAKTEIDEDTIAIGIALPPCHTPSSTITRGEALPPRRQGRYDPLQGAPTVWKRLRHFGQELSRSTAVLGGTGSACGVSGRSAAAADPVTDLFDVGRSAPPDHNRTDRASTPRAEGADGAPPRLRRTTQDLDLVTFHVDLDETNVFEDVVVKLSPRTRSTPSTVADRPDAEASIRPHRSSNV